jgi:hypothetical protein
MKTKQQKLDFILDKVKNIDENQLHLNNIIVDIRFMIMHPDPFLFSHKGLDQIIYRIGLCNSNI